MPEENSGRVRDPRTGALFSVYLVLVLVGYGGTLGDGFLTDDFESLRLVDSATGWGELLSGGRIGERFLRPLAHLTWWAQYQSVGMEPWAFRLFNLAVHSFSAVLVARIGARISARALVGWLGGAAFALHPVHPEAVTWICGRYDLLCTLGVLGAIDQGLSFSRADGRVGSLVLMLIWAAFALASKEMALALPLTLAACVAMAPGSIPRRGLLATACSVLLAAAYLGVRVHWMGGLGGIRLEGESIHGSLQPRRMEFLRDVVALCFTPSFRVDWPVVASLARWAPVLGLGLVWTLFPRGEDRGRLLRLGLFLLLALMFSLAPIATWVSFRWLSGSRYLYLPSAFACLLVALPFGFVPERRRGPALGVGILVLVTWTADLVLENRRWHRAAVHARQMIEGFPLDRLGPGPLGALVTDVPYTTTEGVQLMGDSLGLALRTLRDPTARVRRLERPAWERHPARGEPGVGPTFMRWDALERRWHVDESRD